MERQTGKLRKEIEQARDERTYYGTGRDFLRAVQCDWYLSGLRKALDILEGGDPNPPCPAVEKWCEKHVAEGGGRGAGDEPLGTDYEVWAAEEVDVRAKPTLVARCATAAELYGAIREAGFANDFTEGVVVREREG